MIIYYYYDYDMIIMIMIMIMIMIRAARDNCPAQRLVAICGDTNHLHL